MRKSAVLLVGVLGVFIFLGVLMVQSLVIVQRIASVSEVVGDVYVKARGASDFSPLGDREHVLAGYTVKTGPGAGVTLNWVDGSRIRIGPETTMRVRKCVLNRNTQARTSLFDLEVGRIWVRVLSALSGQNKFEIRTPTATAGVRGTVFLVEVDESGETEVAVYEGEVHLKSRKGEASVPAGHMALVEGGHEPVVQQQPPGALAWEEQTGIIGPRLDLDLGPQVTVPASTKTITITGISEPGATVTINGSQVQLDRKNRFAAEVPINIDSDGIILVTARDMRGATTTRAISVIRE